MALVLRWFDLQPNIRERNPIVKRTPTVFWVSVTTKTRFQVQSNPNGINFDRIHPVVPWQTNSNLFIAFKNNVFLIKNKINLSQHNAINSIKSVNSKSGSRLKQIQSVQYLTFMGPCIVIIFWYISNKMQRYTVYFICKLLYIFQVVPPPIIRSANNCIYSIWYLSHRYCYLPL